MSKLSILALLAILCVANASVISQGSTLQDTQNQLSDLGKAMAPDLKKFDYSVFARDMTPEQVQALSDAVGGGSGGTQIMSTERITSIQNKVAAAQVHIMSPNRAVVTGDDLESIKDFGSFASLTYCSNPSNIKTLSCGAKCQSQRVQGSQVVAVIQGPSTYGFVARRPNQKQILVVFRGSNNFQNWIDNLNFIRKSYPYPTKGLNNNPGSVHEGFVDAYNEMRSQVLSQVSTLSKQYPDHQIVFTGHSLGGAFAVLGAVDAVGTGTVPASRVTVAQYHTPRVGNAQWASMVDNLGFAKVMRVTEENDIVPHLPPSGWPFSFKHNGPERYVDNRKVYACNGDEDGACANSRVPFLNPLTHGQFFDIPMFFGMLLGEGCSANI